MSSPDVNQLIQKTRRYEFADGLRDLQFALLFGLGGLSSWLAFEPFWLALIGNAARTYGRWAAWLGMLPVVLVLLAVWAMLPLMKFVRRRWLWRYTGMVKASRWMVSRRVNLISFAIILGGLALSLVLRALGFGGDWLVLRMLWAATGWGFGYTLAAVGREMGLARYVWLGAAGAGLSTLILFLPLGFGQSALAFGGTWFVLLLASGILTLRAAFRSAANLQP